MSGGFLEGKNIYLRALSIDDDIQSYVAWINDQQTTLYMGCGKVPSNMESIKEYIGKYSNSNNGMLLGIFLKKSAKHIGNITLHLIDWKDRHGEIGIIIGDKNERGKGFSAEAVKLVVEHAFNRLNLRKLYCGMVKGNDASRKTFERMGFKLEGTLRKHFYLNGQYIDCYRYGLLRDEYKGAKV